MPKRFRTTVKVKAQGKVSPKMTRKRGRKGETIKKRHLTYAYKNLSNVFRHQPVDILKGTLKQVAHEFKRDLKQRIREQDFGNDIGERKWPPLNPQYLKWKKAQGLDERMLIATGRYLKSIWVMKRYYGRNLSWQIGVRKQIHGPSGLPYPVLARILEYGSKKRRIPPRPHWRPTLRRIRREQRWRIREALKEAAKKSKKKAVQRLR